MIPTGQSGFQSYEEEIMTTISFYGPYSWWPDGKYPYIKHAPEADQSGIYLWTVVLDEGDLVFYVGETATSFYQRMCGHWRSYTDGVYFVHPAQELARGNKLILWPGVKGRIVNPEGRSREECWENRVRLRKPMEEMTRVFRFFLAPTTFERRIRKRIEAALALTLYNHTDDRIRSFPNPARYEPRTGDEEPFPVVVNAPVRLLGLSDIVIQA
jgi:hypothetical protein